MTPSPDDPRRLQRAEMVEINGMSTHTHRYTHLLCPCPYGSYKGSSPAPFSTAFQFYFSGGRGRNGFLSDMAAECFFRPLLLIVGLLVEKVATIRVSQSGL